MAGRAPQRHRVPTGIRDRDGRLHPAAAVIQARLAAPRRAMRVTVLVLGAALLRALLLPAGDLLSTAVFAACLLGISWMECGTPTLTPQTLASHLRLKRSYRTEARLAWGDAPSAARVGRRARPSPASGEGKVTAPRGIVAGVMVGAVLLAPMVTGRLSARTLSDFWP